MDMIKFADWLQETLDERGLSRADLSRLSGISPSQISKILNLQSAPGKTALQSIALALKVPQETLYRKAGLIDEKGEFDETLAEANHLLSELPDDIQQEALALIRTMHDRHATKQSQDPQTSLAESDA